MKILGLILTALVALGPGGCTKVDTFRCFQSAECVHDGVAGVCEPGGLCSFPDPECPSSKAFGEFAGDQSGRCVDDGPATGTLSDTATTAPTSGTDPTCAPLGDACANTPCCDDPCTRCEDGVCTALPAGATPPNCQPGCSMDGAALDDASCDAGGTCQRDTVSCGLYTCDADAGECRTKCIADSHCVSNQCMGTKCK